MHQMSETRTAMRKHLKDLPRTELPALTSIRALLAWWVVAYHFLPSAPFFLNKAGPVLFKGTLAVDCFFILSGFVLCHVHPAIIGSSSRHGMADFLVSRLARIYPLHLMMLAAFALVVLSYRATHAAGQGAFASDTLPAFVRQVLLFHGWFGTDMMSWNVPSWSISSEWAAYMAAPLIFFCLARIPPTLLLAGLGMAGGITLYLLEAGWLDQPWMELPRVLLEFTIGALIRSLFTHGVGGLRKIRNVGLAVGWLTAAISAFSVHGSIFLTAMVWIMLLLSLRTERADGWLGRVETVTIYLGETSFAVYMCHAFILMLWAGSVQAHLSRFQARHSIEYVVLLIVVIQGLASALHHAVEIPAQRRIRQGFRKWMARSEQLDLQHGRPASSPAGSI